MKLLYRHCKLTTERNRHSQGSGPLGSGPIGPGSGYSVMPGHVTVNKPVISKIYIVAHTWPLCSVQILVDGVNPH